MNNSPMDLYLEFLLITSYMVVTYHIIALKYRKSVGFSSFTQGARVFWVSLHVSIVSTNIIFYLLLVFRDFNLVNILLRACGLLLFAAGIFFIFWGMYSLRKAVFVPGNMLVISGPYRLVRHPMYFGGVTGAFGLAIFAGSRLCFVYSFALAAVLSRIADAEEEVLREEFGTEYVDYANTGKIPSAYSPEVITAAFQPKNLQGTI